MPKGRVYESERAILRDPQTGLTLIRLTHSSCIATSLYFEMCSFTDDELYVVILCQRYAGRDAPWDLFRARTDGLELVQLTEQEDVHGLVVSPETGKVFYQADGFLHMLDLQSLDEATLAEVPGVSPVSPRSLAAVDLRATTYFGNCFDDEHNALLFRVELSNGAAEILYESERQNHITVDAAGETIAFNDWQGDRIVPSFIDSDGRNVRPQPFTLFAHNTWLGDTKKLQGTLLPGGHAIVAIEEGDPEPTILTEGRYYWHSSSSRDGEWIVADTNWPAEGIYLLHVPSSTVTYVCNPQATCSHPQWTHPHPALSPNMRFLLFNSDVTGIGQVYLAELTEEFLADAESGYLYRPNLF